MATCENLRRAPPRRYDLEVTDICQHSTVAKGEQVVAAPALIKKLPLCRFMRDLSNTEKVIPGLDVQPTEER